MRKRIFLPSILLGISVRAYGFNPVAAMAAVQTIDEAMDTTDAAIDLAQETGVDEDLIREAEANVQRLEKLNSGIKKANYISEEIKSFSDFDLSRSKSFASKLRQLTNKARQGKRLMTMITGQKQSSGLQVEAVKVNFRMLDELRNIRLAEFNRYMLEREQDFEARKAIEKVLQEESKARERKWSLYKKKTGSRQ